MLPVGLGFEVLLQRFGCEDTQRMRLVVKGKGKTRRQLIGVDGLAKGRKTVRQLRHSQFYYGGNISRTRPLHLSEAAVLAKAFISSGLYQQRPISAAAIPAA